MLLSHYYCTFLIACDSNCVLKLYPYFTPHNTLDKPELCYITHGKKVAELLSAVTNLVEALAPQVPQGLLQSEGQRLPGTLNMHNERHSENVLVLVVRYLHSLHEFWHRPKRKQVIQHEFYSLCAAPEQFLGLDNTNHHQSD